jgi:hypothetical protein
MKAIFKYISPLLLAGLIYLIFHDFTYQKPSAEIKINKTSKSIANKQSVNYFLQM